MRGATHLSHIRTFSCGFPKCHGIASFRAEHFAQNASPQARQWCLRNDIVKIDLQPEQTGASLSGTQRAGSHGFGICSTPEVLSSGGDAVVTDAFGKDIGCREA
jgi:hypothetical protein